MIIVIGKIVAKPEAHDSIIDLSRKHCERSRAEPGCLAHTVSQDCESPDNFTFVEYWDNMAALQAHFAVPESQEFVRELSSHLSETPQMRIFEATALEADVRS